MRLGFCRVFLLSLAAAAAGCGTSSRDDLGPFEKVSIVTSPAGASAITSAGTACTTPCAARVRTTQILQVKLMRAGCLTQSVTSLPRLKRGPGKVDPYAGSSYSHATLFANLVCGDADGAVAAQSKAGAGRSAALGRAEP